MLRVGETPLFSRLTAPKVAVSSNYEAQEEDPRTAERYVQTTPEDIVNPAYSLVRLAAVIDWDRLDAELGQHFVTVGASALPTRLLAGLMYLQHLYNLSDEAVLDQWLESPYYKYFWGETFSSIACHAIRPAW